MPISVSMSPGYGSLSNTSLVVSAGAPNVGVITVTNTGSSAVSLTSLLVSEATESDSILTQPLIQTPNAPQGTGNAVIGPGASATFTFQYVSNNPYFAGPSPQSPFGPVNNAMLAESVFVLTATATASDGSVASGSMVVPSLATINNFPPAQGGGLVLSQSANAANFMSLLF